MGGGGCSVFWLCQGVWETLFKFPIHLHQHLYNIVTNKITIKTIYYGYILKFILVPSIPRSQFLKYKFDDRIIING